MVGLPDWLRWLTAIGAGGAVATAGHALNAIGRAKTGAASAGVGNPVYSTAELGGLGRPLGPRIPAARIACPDCGDRARGLRAATPAPAPGLTFSCRSFSPPPCAWRFSRAARAGRRPAASAAARDAEPLTESETGSRSRSIQRRGGALLENVRALSSLHRLSASSEHRRRDGRAAGTARPGGGARGAPAVRLLRAACRDGTQAGRGRLAARS